LGTEIPGDYPVNKALASLEKGEIFGIANGRAEFGPRALGNRSLIADPRGGEIKDRMNVIKRRQKFRPFAPMILAQHANDYFDMPGGKMSPYMQYVARCKDPEQFPAIVHADGTSRVQTVTQYDNPGLHKLLTEFYNKTGCPMLVNTSLNIKGQPIVNDVADAKAFARHYGVKVHTSD
jgi:carbamoyltransferase